MSENNTLSLTEQVEDVLDKIRPYIRRDGGDVHLIKIEDNTVYVKLVGACHGCPSASITLKSGIERALKEEISDQLVVEQVTT